MSHGNAPDAYDDACDDCDCFQCSTAEELAGKGPVYEGLT